MKAAHQADAVIRQVGVNSGTWLEDLDMLDEWQISIDFITLLNGINNDYLRHESHQQQRRALYAE